MTALSAVHITRWGTDGPAVVLVHGSVQGSRLGGNQHFSTQQELASRGWRIIIPDRPGHGQSPAPGRPDDGILDGEWVAKLLDGGSHLVGHSFGGVVALCAAAQRPEAVRSLTLIEPALHALAISDPVVHAFIKKQMEIFSSGKSPGEIAVEFSRAAGIPESLRHGPGSPEEMTRVGQSLLQAHFPPDAKLREFAATVARARIPVLIITGGWNPAFEASATVVAQLLNGRHQVVSSPHHFPNLAAPAEFNAVLEKFMRDADGAHGRPS